MEITRHLFEDLGDGGTVQKPVFGFTRADKARQPVVLPRPSPSSQPPRPIVTQPPPQSINAAQSSINTKVPLSLNFVFGLSTTPVVPLISSAPSVTPHPPQIPPRSIMSPIPHSVIFSGGSSSTSAGSSSTFDGRAQIRASATPRTAVPTNFTSSSCSPNDTYADSGFSRARIDGDTLRTEDVVADLAAGCDPSMFADFKKFVAPGSVTRVRLKSANGTTLAVHGRAGINLAKIAGAIR